MNAIVDNDGVRKKIAFCDNKSDFGGRHNAIVEFQSAKIGSDDVMSDVAIDKIINSTKRTRFFNAI